MVFLCFYILRQYTNLAISNMFKIFYHSLIFGHFFSVKYKHLGITVIRYFFLRQGFTIYPRLINYELRVTLNKMSLLSQLPKCCDYSHAPLCLTHVFIVVPKEVCVLSFCFVLFLKFRDSFVRA